MSQEVMLSHEKAAQIAAKLNAEETDGTTYRVKTKGDKYAVIEVIDVDGEVLGTL